MKQAILKSILYRDIFDYPVKTEEIWQFLIEKEGASEEIKEELSCLVENGIIEKADSFYFLPGRKELVKVRKKRKKYSDEKLEIAKKVARFLKILPWVRLVGVSGAVAAGNAKKEDEIDFFIITAPKRLWLARFAVMTLVFLTGKRKFPEEKDVADKICLNYFLSEENLEISPKNLHTAFDLSLLKPLWFRGNSYKKLIERNSWAFKLLPNAELKWSINFESEGKNSNFSLPGIEFCGNLLERFLKNFQEGLMRKPLGNETITSTALRFLAHDHNEEVMRKYKLKIKHALDNLKRFS